jgi:hypothetical protein
MKVACSSQADSAKHTLVPVTKASFGASGRQQNCILHPKHPNSSRSFFDVDSRPFDLTPLRLSTEKVSRFSDQRREQIAPLVLSVLMVRAVKIRSPKKSFSVPVCPRRLRYATRYSSFRWGLPAPRGGFGASSARFVPSISRIRNFGRDWVNCIAVAVHSDRPSLLSFSSFYNLLAPAQVLSSKQSELFRRKISISTSCSPARRCLRCARPQL